jgi:endogenous inhibitor of DNA gyrase (YacG/DUF329 family)
MEQRAVCALCGLRPVEPEWRPFCSRRCQLEDLARWAEGTYRVPGAPVEERDHEDDDN